MPAPGVSVEIKVTGAEEIGAALRRLQDRAGNLAPALRAIGVSLVTSTHHRFERQSGPDGKAWKPLAGSTLMGRAGKKAVRERGKIGGVEYVKLTAKAEKRVAGAKILRRDGRLFQSITHMVLGDRLLVGTNVAYAAIHQLGGDAGRGRKVKIPARPYLGIDAADRAEILATVEDYLAGGLPR